VVQGVLLDTVHAQHRHKAREERFDENLEKTFSHNFYLLHSMQGGITISLLEGEMP